MPVAVTPHGLEIDDSLLPIYSGSVHYWRLERQLWSAILDHVKDMGFRIVETYIPWSIHETEPGAFDWGQRDPSKDLDAFLSLCEQKGLRILARPGPHINAELTLFGYPE